MEFLIKVFEFLVSLRDKLDKDELIFLFVVMLGCIYVGYLISSHLKPVVNTDFKTQCAIYTKLQTQGSPYNVERWLLATTKNGKVVDVGCPFYSRNGKCNNAAKCIKV
ncbi:MAG: hypothetical protein J0647_10940 [Campylobacteraceae bacterium]|nr:hypothetical protein [Campylobacteraceae bacterium]